MKWRGTGDLVNLEILVDSLYNTDLYSTDLGVSKTEQPWRDGPVLDVKCWLMHSLGVKGTSLEERSTEGLGHRDEFGGAKENIEG